jgi:hypothetical protein
MRFVKLALAIAVGIGALVIPAAASASTAYSCSALYYCQETDTPLSGNTAHGSGLPNQVLTLHGTFCLSPYYSADGTVNFAGAANVADPTNGPIDVRWSVWFSTTADMASAVKIFKTEGTGGVRVHVDSGEAGYFWGCIINYDEDNPSAEFGILISQA